MNRLMMACLLGTMMTLALSIGGEDEDGGAPAPEGGGASEDSQLDETQGADTQQGEGTGGPTTETDQGAAEEGESLADLADAGESGGDEEEESDDPDAA